MIILILAVKYLTLKRQLKKLTVQVMELSEGVTEKMLDISFIDRDLEQLASRFNKQYLKQRHTVARALHHEEHLKESIANISHDLRTPLTVIMGHLQLLQTSPLLEEQRQRVEIAQKKALRMKELIGAFYDLSILDSEQIKPQLTQVNYPNLLMNFLTENALLFENRNIRPQIELPEKAVFVQTDTNMLERIWQNIISNAIRYSSGEISVILSESQDGMAVLQVKNSVSDAGNIDTERLFERFFSGDKSRNSESTGLGLAVVKLLVEKLDGEILAELHSDVLTIEFSLEAVTSTEK